MRPTEVRPARPRRGRDDRWNRNRGPGRPGGNPAGGRGSGLGRRFRSRGFGGRRWRCGRLRDRSRHLSSANGCRRNRLLRGPVGPGILGGGGNGLRGRRNLGRLDRLSGGSPLGGGHRNLENGCADSAARTNTPLGDLGGIDPVYGAAARTDDVHAASLNARVGGRRPQAPADRPRYADPPQTPTLAGS